MIKKLNYGNFGIFLGILSVMAVCLCSCGKNTEVFLQESEQSVTQADACDTRDVEEKRESQMASVPTICVYVCGAVKKPGVYTLSDGCRVCDAIEAAGGFKKNASTDFWNQAEYVTDGQMIDVPTRDEAGQEDAEAKVEKASEKSAQGAGDGTPSADGKIDINSATREQLMQIPGVGESRADSIIRYRETTGRFSKIEDIMNVTGIKEGLFAKMKDYISTGS